jgi:hypothetical protein
MMLPHYDPMMDFLKDIWRAPNLAPAWLRWTLRIWLILLMFCVLGFGLRIVSDVYPVGVLKGLFSDDAVIEVPITDAPQAHAPKDIIWLPGRSKVQVADTTGEIEEIQVDETPDVAVRVGDDTILGVTARNPIFPDFAPPPVRVTVIRDGFPVLVTPQKRPLLDVSPVVSAGLGISDGAQSGVLAACPVQVGPIRPCAGGVVRAPSGEDLSIGLAATVTTRVFHPRLRLHIGMSDLLRGAPVLIGGLTWDLRL